MHKAAPLAPCTYAHGIKHASKDNRIYWGIQCGDENEVESLIRDARTGSNKCLA